jgi:transmembrane sensor
MRWVIPKATQEVERLIAGSEWVQRFDEGSATRQTPQWQRWDSVLANDAAFRKIQSIRCALKEPEMRHTLLSLLGALSPPRYRRRPSNWLRLAASVAALLIGPFGNHSTPWRVVVRTEPNAIQRSTLPDGSHIQVNTDSELQVTMTPAGPVMRIERGEAFIRAAPDHERAFSVLAGDLLVRDVGTAFSVRIVDENSVRIVVEEGIVSISQLSQATDPTATSNHPDVRVTADQSVLVRSGSVLSRDTDHFKIECELAWLAQNICLDGQTVSDAVRDFNRHNSKQIVIVDPHSAGLRYIGGMFQAGSPESFVDSVNSATNHETLRISNGNEGQGHRQ